MTDRRRNDQHAVRRGRADGWQLQHLHQCRSSAVEVNDRVKKRACSASARHAFLFVQNSEIGH